MVSGRKTRSSLSDPSAQPFASLKPPRSNSGLRKMDLFVSIAISWVDHSLISSASHSCLLQHNAHKVPALQYLTDLSRLHCPLITVWYSYVLRTLLSRLPNHATPLVPRQNGNFIALPSYLLALFDLMRSRFYYCSTSLFPNPFPFDLPSFQPTGYRRSALLAVRHVHLLHCIHIRYIQDARHRS